MSGWYTPKTGDGGAPRYDLRHDLHGHVADYVMDTDRAWFDQHPDEDSYCRPALDHEFCHPGAATEGRCELAVGALPAGSTLMVEVRQVAPGVRFRLPYAVIGRDR